MCQLTIQLGLFPITLQDEVIGSKERANDKTSLQIPVNLDYKTCSNLWMCLVLEGSSAATNTQNRPVAAVRSAEESTKFHTSTFC